MKRKLTRQVVGNVGLYYVCHKLSLMGWNVMPTARNARGIDIVAYNKSGDKFIRIQVKTLSGRAAASLGSDIEKIQTFKNNWWVILNNAVSGNGVPNSFIMKPGEVKKCAHSNHSKKTGKTYYWLEPKAYKKKFKEKWERIGRGD